MAVRNNRPRPSGGSDLYEDLTSAAMWGRLGLLESLLDNGADPNFPNGMGNTALHEAAYYGERECVSVLLHHKANVNAIGSEGKTPLHKAVTGILVQDYSHWLQEPGPKHETESKIHENQMDIVRLLVAHGADLNITDHSDATPRDLAMQYDFYECADLIDDLTALRAKLAEEQLREERLEDLLDACESGDLAVVEELLQHLPEAVNEFLFDGENLLMRAVRSGHLPIVSSLLLSHGAVAVASPTSNLTALHIACKKGLTAIAVCLLNNLPALLAIDDSPKETSLHIVARDGHTDIMRNLLAVAHQAEMLRSGDASLRDGGAYLYNPKPVPMNDCLPEMSLDVLALSVEDRKTPLHEAAANGHVEIVKMIVKFLQECHACRRDTLMSSLTTGATPQKAYSPISPVSATPTRADLSPFASPTRGSSKKQAAVPGIDMLTLKGCTPFHEAVKAGHFEVMSVLLEAGADINAFIRPSLDTKVNADLSALVYACLNKKPDIVRFLLQHNATDARLKALSRTLRKQFYEIVGLLLCYNGGVKPTPVSSRQAPPTEDTPLQLSIAWNSRNLQFVRSEWLKMVLIEAPRPKSRVGVISQLDVSSNALTRLPIEVFRLTELIQLDFSRNQITELPFVDELPNGGWTCGKLATVDGSSNQLHSLPPSLFALDNLKELNVNCNKVDRIPSSVWTAPKLTKLHLNHNSLPAFPTHCVLDGNDSPFWGESISNPPTPGAGGSGGGNIGSFSGISPPDSGYKSSDPKDSGTALDPILESLDLSRNPLSSTPFPSLPYQSLVGGTAPRGSPSLLEKHTHTQSFVSRRFENFHDANVEVEEFEDLEEEAEREPGDIFCLEVLDLSHNKLTAVPLGLSCLAPRLQKLNVSHNSIKSLGVISDYPPDVELLDASNNELHSAVAHAIGDTRSVSVCARKCIGAASRSSLCEPSTPVFAYKSCAHKLHKNLRKLSTLKLNSNQLVDVQLFRFVTRSREFTMSVEESMAFKVRANTADTAVQIKTTPGKVDISRSVYIPRQISRKDATRKSDNSPSVRRASEIVTTPTRTEGSHSGSSSSQEGSGSTPMSPASAVTPLYPQLSTLELARNKLTSVPAHVHLMSNLSCLVVSHNSAIDTLPLELSTLEHLWNLEYEGCPLTNPPVGDLDKFRLASDKLMYMRSLLHDAKPNESLKLMLVGLQRMGKTTLLSRLKEVRESATPLTTFSQRISGEAPPTPARGKKRIDTLSTVGVDLGVWRYRKDLEPDFVKSQRGKKPSQPFRSVTFYTWDFGGQEEYYVTHQCFLSTRSLYLVVWNVTEGEEAVAELGPWLHNIQARAPGSPVVIVGTHCDLLHGERERRKLELNNSIYQRYLVGRGPQALREMGLPKILDVLYVGCPLVGRPEGVAELRKALYDIAFALNVPRSGMTALKTKLLEQPIPANFLLLEERVRELAAACALHEDPPVLRESVFREATEDIIANPRELNQAVTFLHENGVMLHYATPALSHLYFVNPQWLCDMLAHVVTVPEVNRFIQRNDGPEAGILRTTVLSHVFKGNVFPQAHRKEYIELLGKFEVALILDRHRLLVPSMLPVRPSFTIHCFANVFPRPSLQDMLENAPLSPLFSATATAATSGIEEVDNGGPSLPPPPPSSDQADIGSHSSEEFYRSGLLLRRFYFMTYVPSGFWPRLISRFLSSSRFAATVLRSLDLDEQQVKETTSQLVTGQLNGAVSLEWSYWRCGIELWYKGLSLLRVAEIVPDGIYKDCKSSPSIFNQCSTTPIEPTNDVSDLSFELGGLWMPVDMTPNRGIEILVPDTISTATLQRERDTWMSSEDGSPQRSYEAHWMSAALLAQTVDYLDTLLEDWYPGLGARDGNRTVESVPYVNRVVPCPFCVNGATPHTAGSKVLGSCMPTIAESSSESSCDTNRSDEFPEPVKTFSPAPSRARRSLFVTEDDDEATPPIRRSTRKGSLADIHRMAPRAEVKDVTPPPSPLGAPPRALVGSESGLTMATRFGFMIESCILASRQPRPLTCPAHSDHTLSVMDLAPDVVFADLPSSFLLDPACVNKGEYIDHGSFGDIYHGAVYPTPNATDDEGREVAIKIDRLDSKKYDAETATKAYIEVRAEVSILRSLDHRHVIEFIGVVLQPLCFILEWAPGGSLSSVFQKYRKMDARIAPLTLQQTALQVASGLAYLHEKSIVYYDLKSPNILVFHFPSAQESLAASQPLPTGTAPPSTELSPVFVKIADLGISRILTPGGVMGFKGSPGFMAPEILKYVGTEACTEKVDVFSYGMFLYEMISLHFPFEKQNLMHSQIERLVIEGERPPLQNRELNTPILYLDVMRWCWQQDFRNRPSAEQLQEVLSNPAIPRLVDAISLHHSAAVTCACICTLPIEVMSPDHAVGEVPTPHPHVARGDLQEELWLATFTAEQEGRENRGEVVVINFRGKTNFSTECFPVCGSEVAAMCCVNHTVWLGSAEGLLCVFDATSRQQLLQRLLAVLPNQGVTGIIHLHDLRHVLVTRRDGCVLLFDQDIQEHKLPDDSRFDNHINSTQLPVRSVFKTPERLPLVNAIAVKLPKSGKTMLWCGSSYEMCLVFDVAQSRIEYCRKLYSRSRYDTFEDHRIAAVVSVAVGEGEVLVWGLSQPSSVLYCWSASSERLLRTVSIEQFSPEPVTGLSVTGSQLQVVLTTSKMLQLETAGDAIVSSTELRGHVGETFTLLSLGARTLPRHWLPTIIGRSNAIDYYRDLLGDDDIESIQSTMLGRQCKLLVTVGSGFYGVAGQLVEPIMSQRDCEDTFLLLWAVT